MSRLRFAIVAAALAAFNAGCRTTAEGDEVVLKSGPPAGAPGFPAGAPGPGECPVAASVCSDTPLTMACAAKAYDSRPLPPSRELMAWGRSPCAARLALAKAACAANLSPSLLGRVSCIPDPSDGRCPPRHPACPEALVPTVCAAKGYGAQDLSPAQQLHAFGLNQCLAELALRTAACRQNLDPKNLARVTCEFDALEGECPLPPAAPCNDPPRRAYCRALKVIGEPLPKPLAANGASVCEAKRELEALACAAGLRPSRLDAVVCEFPK